MGKEFQSDMCQLCAIASTLSDAASDESDDMTAAVGQIKCLEQALTAFDVLEDVEFAVRHGRDKPLNG